MAKGAIVSVQPCTQSEACEIAERLGWRVIRRDRNGAPGEPNWIDTDYEWMLLTDAMRLIDAARGIVKDKYEYTP